MQGEFAVDFSRPKNPKITYSLEADHKDFYLNTDIILERIKIMETAELSVSNIGNTVIRMGRMNVVGAEEFAKHAEAVK